MAYIFNDDDIVLCRTAGMGKDIFFTITSGFLRYFIVQRKKTALFEK